MTSLECTLMSVTDARSLLSEYRIGAVYDTSSGQSEFVGMGFIGPGGEFTKFADPEKANALRVLECAYLRQVQEINDLYDRTMSKTK